MDNEPLPPAAASVAAAPELVGFWVRGGAFLIDTLLLAVTAFLPGHGLGILAGFAYKTIFIAQGGQTPGKMAAGIKVVEVSGEPVGFGRAFVRAVAEYASAFLLLLGYIIAAAPAKRALHDYFAGTRVVYLEGVTKGRKTAFALLGILSLAGFVALIAASAYLGLGTFGRYKSLIKRSGEGVTKGNLGALRSTLSIYYGDSEGKYPATLEELVPKYLPAIPQTKLSDHAPTAAWTAYGAEVCGSQVGPYGTTGIDATKLKDTGGWGYVTDPKARCYGQLFVDCTHADSKGRPWPDY